MSNIVEIKYGRSGKFPKILINGEEMSRYMSLSNYIYDDIFNWVDQFYEIFDSEFEEDYEVILTGHKYQLTVLKAELSKSRHCKNVVFKPVVTKISNHDKVIAFKELNEQHHFLKHDVNKEILYKCDNLEELAFLKEYNINFDNVSKYYICQEQGFNYDIDCTYYINICNENSFKKVKGTSYINVTKNDLKDLFDYINEFHLYLDILEECSSLILNGSLPKEVKLEMEAYMSEEYRFEFEEINSSLNYNETFEIKYDYYPKCFAPLELSVKTSNNLIEVNGLTLTCKDQGVCDVVVIDANGKEYLKQTITIVKHNYVQNIDIVLTKTSMVIGETMLFRTILMPYDAEDAHLVKYEVNDKKIAVISNKNEIYAVGSGRLVVTASTPRVSKKFYIEVYANPQRIKVSSEELDTEPRCEVTVYAEVLPLNLKEKPVITWETDNPKLINIKGTSEHKCVFVTKDIGEAKIICSASGTTIKQEIKVHIKKQKGCYVATAVYGSYDCNEVWVLRRFRDNCLDKTWFGRLFIKTYYAISPTIVKIFGKSKLFNKTWKFVLDKMVNRLKNKGYEETPYKDKY